MDAKLKKLFDGYTDIQEKRMTSYFNFLRTITTISTGLLALLVGLKPDQIQQGTPQYLFLATISLLGFGILSSVITQSYEVAFLKQQTKALHKYIKHVVEKKVEPTSGIRVLPKPKIYTVSEVATFCCLGLS